MKKISKFLIRFWPLIALLIVELILFAANYKPGTYLMGWDNVMPEFNFRANLVRNLSGVWQEHRGLGLYDGMSHIALALHTVFLWFLSLFLPTNLLRYVFNFLMHFLGGMGMYFFVRFIYSSRDPDIHLKNIKMIGKIEKFTNNNSHPASRDSNSKIIPLIAALFYLFNPATIQMFYIPLESFSVHFAALPWLSLTLINLLQQGSKKSYLWFILITLLVTPQYFVTTLFLSTLCLVLPIIFVYFCRNINRQTLKRSLMVLISFLIINSFWLLPYAKGVPQNAPVIQEAKINLMSSNEIFLRNQAFGDLKDILLLRGFTLDFTDLNSTGINHLMMQPWRDFLYHPVITAISVVLLLITIIGLIKQKHKPYLLPFSIIFLIGFVMLGTDVPFLRELIAALRKHIPLFGEVFRFTFTKFGLIFTFAYTIFLINGISELASFIKLKFVVYALSIIIVLIIAIPGFQGHFYYEQLKVELPQSYLNLFKFSQHLDPNVRTAILPQSDFWSWKNYQFGYRGSGFLWYGIPQPILDRAFDPWSNTNEEYYWELSQAIYQKNTVLFRQILNKYDVGYLILDEYLTASGSQKALYTDEIKNLISSDPDIEQIGIFGKISVYGVKNVKKQTFVSIETGLPKIAPVINWLENDQALIDFGNYISRDTKTNIYYPFRSLFTKRYSLNKNLDVSETGETLTIRSQNIPREFLDTFTEVLATEGGKLVSNGKQMEFVLDKKTLIYNSDLAQVITPDFVNNKCNLLKTGTAESQLHNENQYSFLELSAFNQRNCLAFGIPDLPHKMSYLFEVISRNITGQPLRMSLINTTAKHMELEIFLTQGNNWHSDYFIIPPLAQDGLGYDFFAVNDAVGRYESVNDIRQISAYIIPYEFLKNFKLVNPDSSTSELHSTPTTNNQQPISVSHPNPAEYILSLDMQNNPGQTTNNQQPTTLILSQSYNDGWLAYEVSSCELSVVSCKLKRLFPFIFGKRLTNHVLVNNWANGWVLDERIASSDKAYSENNNYTLNLPAGKAGANSLNADSITIYILFWPQLLEYLGFILLPLPFIFIFKK